MSDRYGWDAATLAASRIFESRAVENAELPTGGGSNRVVQLVKWTAGEKGARPMRVTMRALQRTDGPMFTTQGTGVAPLVLPSPTGWSRTGIALAAAVAERPLNGVPAYALLEWGTGGGQRNLLVADWPTIGASVDVVASDVRLDAMWGPVNPRNTPTDRAPVFAADLAPCDGGGPESCLTFAQTVTVPGGAVNCGAVAVPSFARAVEVNVQDPRIWETDSGVLSIIWRDSSGATVYHRHDIRRQYSTDGAAVVRAGTEPIRLDVPAGAAIAVLVAGGATGSDVNLLWTLQP